MKFGKVFVLLCCVVSFSVLLSACAGAPAGLEETVSPTTVSKDEAVAPAPVAMESAKGMSATSGGSPGSSGTASRPSSSGLKAGFSDDNAQFNYFVDFLEKYKDVGHYSYDISNRMTLRILDKNGKPVMNAAVEIFTAENKGKGRLRLESGVSASDGTFRFYPQELVKKTVDANTKDAKLDFVWVVVTYEGQRVEKLVDANGLRVQEILLQSSRIIKQQLPLDVLFVMDTTGSMGEEINRLKATIQIINDNAASLNPKPLVRFGMVLYKDKGDEYVTKVIQLTANLDAFEKELSKVNASGGGDRPEDLESALDDTINKINWNKDGIRLAFIVTDADAHLDYGRTYNYINAASDAKNLGIKLYSIGTGGLPLEGEYLLRQVSQLSNARYIFLTYGEKSESEGGTEGSVSHHTGSNFTTDKLEAIVIKFVREELSFQTDTPISGEEEFFEAQKIESQKNEEILAELFEQAVNNLLDYSSYKVTKDTAIALLPVAAQLDENKTSAEYFSEQILVAASKQIGRAHV